MSDTYNGGPAFPSKNRVFRQGYETNEFEPVGGMTLRDYFAAKALAVLYMEADDDDHSAQRAYEMADAMLQARKK